MKDQGGLWLLQFLLYKVQDIIHVFGAFYVFKDLYDPALLIQKEGGALQAPDPAAINFSWFIGAVKTAGLHLCVTKE